MTLGRWGGVIGAHCTFTVRAGIMFWGEEGKDMTFCFELVGKDGIFVPTDETV